MRKLGEYILALFGRLTSSLTNRLSFDEQVGASKKQKACKSYNLQAFE
ncbi:MAG: hypothetical protein J0L67_21045 [Cytophagales bacterium]|nr:hypothetical protein [Cytophagales bacterium]